MADKFNAGFVAKVARAIDANIVNQATQIGLVAMREVVTETPVDLGQARGGWKLTAMQKETRSPVAPPEGSTLPAPPVKIDGRLRAGGTLYLTNGVAHIVFLNEGSSKNAPPQFIEQSLVRAVNSVKSRGNIPV